MMRKLPNMMTGDGDGDGDDDDDDDDADDDDGIHPSLTVISMHTCGL